MRGRLGSGAVLLAMFVLVGCTTVPTVTPTPTSVPPTTSPTTSPTLPSPSPTPTVTPTVTPTTVAPPTPVPGMTYPPRIEGQWIYDYAGIFSLEAEQAANDKIGLISFRAGQVMVYTQHKPSAATISTIEDVDALMREWGFEGPGPHVGSALAMLFNIIRTPCLPGVAGNGQLQMHGTDNFWIGRDERDAILRDTMQPRLAACDFDGALLAALDEMIAAIPTPRPSRRPGP